jgi:hypothetical protein
MKWTPRLDFSEVRLDVTAENFLSGGTGSRENSLFCYGCNFKSLQKCFTLDTGDNHTPLAPAL